MTDICILGAFMTLLSNKSRSAKSCSTKNNARPGTRTLSLEIKSLTR